MDKVNNLRLKELLDEVPGLQEKIQQGDWANLEVQGHVNWPQKATLIFFGKWEMLLFPGNGKYHDSLHVDLQKNGLEHPSYLTVVNRFMSAVSWRDGHFLINNYGGSGSPFPIPINRGPLSFVRADFWIKLDDPSTAPSHQLALALYREAQNLRYFHSPPYAILGFTRILNILHHSKGVINWIDSNHRIVIKEYPHLSGIAIDIQRKAEASGMTVGGFIWGLRRSATAHGLRETIDPDDILQINEISNELDFMEALARYFMINELGLTAFTLQ